MKNKFYLLCFLFFMVLGSFGAKAQYHITSTRWINYSYCTSPQLYITTNAYSSSLSITAYYGNGTSWTSDTTILNGGSYGYCYCPSFFSFPGTYSIKCVLYDGVTAVDSSINRYYEYYYCSTALIKCVNDASGSGIFDSALDYSSNFPVKIEIDHNGVPVDTTDITSGIYYTMTGAVGDIYAFRVLSMPSGLDVSFPSSGVIYDTIQSSVYGYIPKYFGFRCAVGSSFDLAVNAIVPVTGVCDQWGNICVTNTSCESEHTMVTLNFSPKYTFSVASPAPASISGTTVTWDISGLDLTPSPFDIFYDVYDGLCDLTVGDTVHEQVTVTPTAGDSNPANNVEIIIDTVRAGCDPNEMTVSPAGVIAAGTTLTYTARFVKTGNDTAYNISLYDTLSDNVNVKSLNIVSATAAMNIAVLYQGGHNIVKFDFPNINLLDTASHGISAGEVVFTINSLTGLADGTTIFNHAGIFFDYNPVVMTNYVEDIIGRPTSAASVNRAASKVQLYPNPANAELSVNIYNNDYTTYRVTNTLGSVMKQQQLTGAQTTINIGSLPPGFYYISLVGESDTQALPFVKE